MHSQSERQVPPPGCPAHQTAERVPLYGPEFANDPEPFYDRLREFGPAGPVELLPGVDAMLVTDYATALQVLQNNDLFVRDSRRWKALNEGLIPKDSPVLPMLGYRPNALFSDGAEHLRLRQAITDSLAKVDSHRLGRHVDQVSAYLINQFCGRGSADLLNEYGKLVALLVFNELFGCPPSIGDQLLAGMSGIFDGVDSDRANSDLNQALSDLVALKRQRPGEDITTWLIQHPARLGNEELMHQVSVLLAGGTQNTQNLIVNALRLLLSDDRYAGGEHGAGLLVDDAITEVLWNSPPLANFGPHYATQDTELSGVPVKAGTPLLISYAAANTDPTLSEARQTLSKRAHLAWAAGPHACPAKDPAQVIVVTAIEKLLNHLPDVELAVPAQNLMWRPGPFHRALTSLPTRFTPVAPERRPANHHRPGTNWDVPAAPAASAQAKPGKTSWWSSFLTWSKS